MTKMVTLRYMIMGCIITELNFEYLESPSNANESGHQLYENTCKQLFKTFCYKITSLLFWFNNEFLNVKNNLIYMIISSTC